ncbi:hydroxybutyryl-CoA reductase for ethylmalonate biosynthesis (plasmid) [Streptomyces sp. GBA 94-10 4N24]|uniref:class I SAM-dependent DNA methyltransferase n=1 Tax=Actinomycetes TaxID=1760 RepID=UPI00031884AB|nr:MULTISPECIES: class I SAM-dependent methyltransferase [unclassified Streptomyces]ESP95597.1 hydroxybutyryl-CoA reductase for ethylmalonate biosynthesis [Streptomyces sp. GBA 94-10 4N24]UZN63059.1 hydroxybutyryl-CoA reductase for ethylmalonate biosynthesis [Streptomyces sp. GBA 94-10 4N24]
MTSTVADIGYGTQFATWYDRIFPKGGDAQATADVLAGLHPDPGAGTLEFGVGTGRIALPLSQKTGQVMGVDSSPEMLAQLAEAGSENVVPVHADIRTYTDTRQYGLVYVVCGTLSMLLSAEDQQEAVCRAAELLTPGGRLVVETGNLPAVQALHDGQARCTLFTPYPEPGTGLQTHSTLSSEIWQCSHIWYESDGSTRVGSELARLTTPDEVDRYAAVAGLAPEGRYADWSLSSYTEQYPMFLTTYTKNA